MDERKKLMLALRDGALAARVSLYTLASEANVSGTVVTRWVNMLNGKGGCVPSLATIGRLERALVAHQARA